MWFLCVIISNSHVFPCCAILHATWADQNKLIATDRAKYKDSALLGYDALSLVTNVKEKLLRSPGAKSEVDGQVT
jgi:hypothetical protein